MEASDLMASAGLERQDENNNNDNNSINCNNNISINCNNNNSSGSGTGRILGARNEQSEVQFSEAKM